MARDEAVVYGVRAALAVAARRPAAILRVFFDESHRHLLGPLLKATAAGRRPYREVPPEDLDKLAQSKHHEGVVVVTTPIPLAPLDAVLPPRPEAAVLALDEVGNPHNVGAIIRSAAWFGAAGLVIPRGPRQASLSAASMRVAQGGAEIVPVVGVDHLADALRQLAAAGYRVIGADQGAKKSAFELPRGPVCLVLGNESDGLSAEIRAACAGFVQIPGTGALESLNVAVSAGVLLAAHFQRAHA